MIKRPLFSALFTFLIFMSFAVQQGFAQENDEQNIAVEDTVQRDYSVFADKPLSADINPFWTPEETGLKKTLRYSTLIGVPLMVAIYGFEVWDWGEDDPRFYRERWFQEDTDSGGADKTGHFLAHYIVARGCYSVFSYTEQNQNRALAYSAITSTVVGLLIEMGDAFTGRYGFSYEDLLANQLGVLAAVILDRYPVADEFIAFTGHYWPTRAHKKHADNLNIPGDYSGWTYYMNFKLAGFGYIGYDIPDFMRYIQLDIGYYTRNYTNRDQRSGIDTENERQRYWFFGASVNMREVARDLFRHNRKASWVAEQPFKYYHVPIGYTNDREI